MAATTLKNAASSAMAATTWQNAASSWYASWAQGFPVDEHSPEGLVLVHTFPDILATCRRGNAFAIAVMVLTLLRADELLWPDMWLDASLKHNDFAAIILVGNAFALCCSSYYIPRAEKRHGILYAHRLFARISILTQLFMLCVATPMAVHRKAERHSLTAGGGGSPLVCMTLGGLTLILICFIHLAMIPLHYRAVMHVGVAACVITAPRYSQLGHVQEVVILLLSLALGELIGLSVQRMIRRSFAVTRAAQADQQRLTSRLEQMDAEKERLLYELQLEQKRAGAAARRKPASSYGSESELVGAAHSLAGGDACGGREKSRARRFVTVVGGGNSTPIFAALAAEAGHTVAILTRRPGDWDANDIGFLNEDEGYIGGRTELRTKIALVTADPAACIPQSDLIFLAGLPIHHNPEVLGKIKPHMDMKKKVYVGSICAYGGFNWVAAEALGPGNYSLFGTQLIPWCCGTPEGGYGRTGVVFGAKRLLRIATEGGEDKDQVKPILAKILQMPFLSDTDFLASTLWPNNPSLHPPILYGLFKDWDGVAPYDPATLPTLIYADMRTESAKVLVAEDTELTNICKKLSTLYPKNRHMKSDFSMYHCVNQNYEEQITCKWDAVSSILTNKAFGKHKIPYTKVEGGVVPTLKHKFFETDLPFGLCTFVDIARMVGVETPTIDAMILWNQKLIGKEYMTASGKIDGKDAGECILPSAFGLTATTLEYGNRKSDESPMEPAAKVQKK